MIPDFKTYINESIWTNINKRSEGGLERKEDDIEELNNIEFCKYLKSRYDVVNSSNGETIWTSESNIVTIPILMNPKSKYEQNGKKYNHVCFLQIWDINYDKRDMSVHISGDAMRKDNAFSQTLKEQYTILNNNYFWSEIRPLAINGRFIKPTKKFIIKLIDFIMEHPYPYKPMLAIK